MSSIVSAVTGGDGKGVGFNAKGADLISPVTRTQIDNSYNQTQNGLQQQQDFVNAVNAQNGLGNQTSVFNQMQGVANGTGPNPAQAQLANATGANVANQAALMAGQRGAGANAGMMARQAAMAGSNAQQQAAGQAAALQANQSLGALNQMGGLATNQANQQANATNAYSQSALNQQQNLLGAAGAYNNAQVGMQSNLNNVNGAMQGGIAGQQGNMLGNMMGGIGSVAQMIPNMFSGGGGMAGSQVGGAMAGDAASSMGGDALTMMAAKGGMVPKKYAEGGMTDLAPVAGPQSNIGKSFMDSQDDIGAANLAAPAPLAPKMGAGSQSGEMPNIGQALNIGSKALDWFGHGISDAGQWLGGGITGALEAGGSAWGGAMAGAGEGIGASGVMEGAATAAPVVAAAAKGGKVPALVSPGEKYLSPKAVEQVKRGASPMAQGQEVPGKPKVAGAKNSYSNDTVRADLEPGGIVLPRSVTQSKDPAQKAAEFVAAILKRDALKKGK